MTIYGYAQQLQDDNSALINAYFQQAQAKKTTNTPTAVTHIIQQGNFNFVQANLNTSKQQSLTVNQQGNQNFAALLSYFSTTPLNLTILQKGNNNGIHIFGENNLIKNAVIRQDANDQHIIISNQ